MSNTIRVTKEFIFDMAHALHGYDGPCKNIHGHTYHLFVTLRGIAIDDASNPKLGMILDFKELKEIVKEFIIDKFDHALVLNNNSPHKELLTQLQTQFEKIILLDIQPTCENLLMHYKNVLIKELSGKYELVYLKLNETPTSYAEWLIEDN